MRSLNCHNCTLHTGSHLVIAGLICCMGEKKLEAICMCECVVFDKVPVLNLSTCKEHIVMCCLMCILQLFAHCAVSMIRHAGILINLRFRKPAEVWDRLALLPPQPSAHLHYPSISGGRVQDRWHAGMLLELRQPGSYKFKSKVWEEK